MKPRATKTEITIIAQNGFVKPCELKGQKKTKKSKSPAIYPFHHFVSDLEEAGN